LLPAPVSLPGYLRIGWRGNRPSRATVLGLKIISKLLTDKVNDSLMVNRCQVCRPDRPNLPRRVIDVMALPAGGISPAAIPATRSRRSASVAPREGRGQAIRGPGKTSLLTIIGGRQLYSAPDRPPAGAAAHGEEPSSARASPPTAVHRSS
jgi:hypothetical protein